MKKLLYIIMFCIISIFTCNASEISDAKTKMEKLYNEYRILAKNNPAVEFRDSDNAAINISFTVSQNIKNEKEKIHYPKGLTIINHKFICPFCKHVHNTSTGTCPTCHGISYGYGSVRTRESSFCINKKSVHAFYQWKAFYDKIDATQEANVKIDEKYEEYLSAKQEYQDLMNAFRKGSNISKNTQKSTFNVKNNLNEDFNEDSNEKQITIRLKKSSLKKLEDNGILENSKLKIILIDDSELQ